MTEGSGSGGRGLEPHVPDAAPVIDALPGVEAVEVADRDVGDGLRLGQAQVEAHAAPTLGVGGQAAPVGDDPAGGTEVGGEAGVAPDVDGRLAVDMHIDALVAVAPERAAAAAHRAIAGGGVAQRAIETPAHLAAVTPSLQHPHLRAVRATSRGC